MHTFEGNHRPLKNGGLLPEEHLFICPTFTSAFAYLHKLYLLYAEKKRREISYSLICLTAWQLICLFWLFYYPLFIYLFHHCLSL